MTIDELRKSGWIMYEIQAGSHLYGIDDENSDVDVRGIFNVPLYQYLCQRHAKKITINNDDADVVFMEIVTYLNLATEGSPNVVDWLFHPNAEELCDSLEMCELIDKRDAFVTKQFLSRSLAMATSMIVRGKKKWEDGDKKAAWKMLAHGKRITLTIGAYIGTSKYNPVLGERCAKIVRTIKRPEEKNNNESEFYEVRNLVELGINSLIKTIDDIDLPSRFDPNLKDELILNFKTKYHGIEAPE